MSVDMTQFIQTFFEESAEGLDVMESGLLELDVGRADDEMVNTIFRAAHSIKGGSATFGFDNVASFTHGMETLLDEMRDHQREVSDGIVDLLLQAVDCLRIMLMAERDGGDVDESRVEAIQRELQKLLDSEAGVGVVDDPVSISPKGDRIWQIEFKPHPLMMQCGNDPVRILRELESLGDLQVTADASGLPAFSELTPEECYLSWSLRLTGAVNREQIDEVFAWVEDDCDLEITEVKTDPTDSADVVVSEVSDASGELIQERRRDDRRTGDRRTAGVSMGDGGSIRVGIDKVDAVIDLVGELVTTQSMLSTLGEDFEMNRLDSMLEALDQLERNTRDLQENIMRIRMLPISFVFSRFPRMVHDLSQSLNKKIELVLKGEQTELDKTVIEKIGDPLVHLVRNSLDHGIELPEERIKAGKPETGTVTLNAYHKGGNIMIEIGDDGRGLDRERLRVKGVKNGIFKEDEEVSDEQIFDLIFMPGISTAEQVSDVSGRGVGMDVVRRNIQGLGGSIIVSSEEGCGTKISIRLPLTLAILEGQLISVGEECYVVPLVSVIESLQVSSDQVNQVAGKGEVFKFREEFLPVVRLYDRFGVEPKVFDIEKGLIMVVEADGRKLGLFVDDLLGQQQVAIKSLESNFQRVEGMSGATILGDGKVALIIDVPSLVRMQSLH